MVKLRTLRRRTAHRWSKFKKKYPRIATAAKGFFPSLYYQIPMVGSIIATRPEFLTYFDIPKNHIPENLWVWLSIGSAVFIPVVHFTKLGIKKLFGRTNGKLDEKNKFVMVDMVGSSPSYFVDVAISRRVTSNFSENELLYIPTSFAIGVTSAYVGLGLLWYFKNRKYFRNLEGDRTKIGYWKRLKTFFVLGFDQNAGGILLEKIAPNSRIVKRMKEISEEAREIQQTEKTNALEDMIELMGIQRGGDLHMVPICMGIMGVILASGISGPGAFILYFMISQPVKIANGFWKNTSGIGLFEPRIEEKVG